MTAAQLHHSPLTGHRRRVDQKEPAGEGTHSATAICRTTPTRPSPLRANPTSLGSDHYSPDAHPSNAAARLVDPTLLTLTASLSDVERTRISARNRLFQMTSARVDTDGVDRGLGLPDDHPAVMIQRQLADELTQAEHMLTMAVKRAIRKHPIGPWAKTQIGIGEKQVARLLGVIGDPYWNTLHNRPRTVSELWAYSGLHVIPGHVLADTQHDTAGEQSTLGGDPGHSRLDTQTRPAGVAPKRRKGQRANWSTEAGIRAHLIAESCVKQVRSPYRTTYDARRAHTATTHPEWAAGHSHNDALRITAKAVLRDLWCEAKRIHEENIP